MTPLLVLVDLQEDFLADPGLEPHRDTVVAGAGALLAAARSNGFRIVHVHTRVTREPDNRMPHWKAAGRWPCLTGTPGQAPPAVLAPLDREVVLDKTGFGVTGGALEAAAAGCDFAVVAGVHTHACVRQAVVALHQAGLAVAVAAEGIGSHEPAHAAQTEVWLRQRGISFLSNAEILERRFGQDAHPRVDMWPEMHPPEPDLVKRLGVLEAIADLVDAHAAELAARIVTEIGKPVRYARGEVARSAALFRAVAGRAATQSLESAEVEALVRRRPLGTVAVITPWNNPLAIAAGQLAPAFAYGNAMVWKPSPAGRGCAELLYRLMVDGGIDPRSFHHLSGGADTGLALARRPDIDAVCFTGSTAAGRVYAALCSERAIPLQAELGGNNAAIVAASADLDRAAALIADAAFGCAGQRCTATRRVIVLSDVYDSFLAALEDATAQLPWGDPQRDDTIVGPLAHVAHAQKIARLIARSRDSGHTVLQPHTRAPDGPAFVAPAMILCDDPQAEIVQEESFGPVLAVQRAADFPDALRLQNGVRQGLAAALFSDRPEEQQLFLRTAKAGLLKINQGTVEAGVDVPFLGWKLSGVGPPQHGAGNLEFFTRAQSVYGLT
jgi:acyl-CoA reductase-like NAD-dependent aldehyde dehydrogenase/nicotinamidase-related amidase